MPGTPARSGGEVILAGSGVLAIVAVAGVGLAMVSIASTATPALAATVPVTLSPSIAMPGLPVTFTVACGPG